MRTKSLYFEVVCLEVLPEYFNRVLNTPSAELNHRAKISSLPFWCRAFLSTLYLGVSPRHNKNVKLSLCACNKLTDNVSTWPCTSQELIRRDGNTRVTICRCCCTIRLRCYGNLF